MASNSSPNLIKRVQTTLPHDAPVDLAGLGHLGVSATLAAYYAKHGWLIRVGQGVYAFPGTQLNIEKSTKLIQTHVPGLHIAGKSALAMQGVLHTLGHEKTLVLWGNTRFTVPEWFTSRFHSRYVSATLFKWPVPDLEQLTLTTPPGVTQDLKVQSPNGLC